MRSIVSRQWAGRCSWEGRAFSSGLPSLGSTTGTAPVWFTLILVISAVSVVRDLIELWPPAWPLVPSQSTHRSPSTSPVSSSLFALCLPSKEPSAGPYAGVTVTCQPSSPTWCARSSSWPRLAAWHALASLAEYSLISSKPRTRYPTREQRQLAGHHTREQPKQQLAGRSCRPTCEQLQAASLAGCLRVRAIAHGPPDAPCASSRRSPPPHTWAAGHSPDVRKLVHASSGEKKKKKEDGALLRTCGDKSKHCTIYKKLSSVLINGYKKSYITVLDGTTVLCQSP
jgi:hypothetical protein